MMANAIPIANAQPIWKREPNAVTPIGFSALRVKEAMAAMPGKLSIKRSVDAMVRLSFQGNSHVVKDAGGFGHALSQPSWSGIAQQMSFYSPWSCWGQRKSPSVLEIELSLRDGLTRNDMSGIVLLYSFSSTEFD